MHSVRSRGGQHTSLSARRDAGFIDPNRLARRRTKPGDAGPSCEGVPTGGIASPGPASALVADSVGIFIGDALVRHFQGKRADLRHESPV